MCGIVGLLSYGKLADEEENTRQEIMRFLTTELLIQTEERGKDATGIATLFDDGDFMCQKMGVTASEFVFRHDGKETDYNGYMKLWGEYNHPAKIVIAHCRKSSVGNTTNNGNNHPVRVGNICAVHNGTLSNHNKIFTNLDITRNDDVDTEAIVQLMKYYTDDGKHPWTTNILKKVNEKLEGSFAVLAFNANNPYQLAVMRDTRPIDVCWVKPLNMAILVSDDKFVKTTLMKYKLQKEIYGKTSWPSISSGDIVMRAMGNMHLSVFNLLETPTSVTTIDDIAEDITVTYKHNSEWSNKATYTSNNGYGNYGQKSNAIGFETQYNKNKNKSESSSTPKLAGRVWNKDLHKYTDISKADVEKGTKDGNQTINLGNTSEEKTIVNEISLDQAEFDKSEAISNVKIIDLENGSLYNKPKGTIGPEEEPKTIDVVPDVVQSVSGDAGDTVNVDMTVDVEAMEYANEQARSVPRFSTNDEVCDKLNIKDAHILSKIPTPGLANMIQNNAWKEGFMAGWQTKSPSSTVIKREFQSTDNIRTLKAVVDITSDTITKCLPFINKTMVDGFITDAVDDAVKNKAIDLAISRVNNVFSEGDKRKNSMIRDITDKVKTAQKD